MLPPAARGARPVGVAHVRRPHLPLTSSAASAPAPPHAMKATMLLRITRIQVESLTIAPAAVLRGGLSCPALSPTRLRCEALTLAIRSLPWSLWLSLGHPSPSLVAHTVAVAVLVRPIAEFRGG